MNNGRFSSLAISAPLREIQNSATENLSEKQENSVLQCSGLNLWND